MVSQVDIGYDRCLCHMFFFTSLDVTDVIAKDVMAILPCDNICHHQMWVSCTEYYFPIHQMKPCQVDWQKLVFQEKIILFQRK